MNLPRMQRGNLNMDLLDALVQAAYDSGYLVGRMTRANRPETPEQLEKHHELVEAAVEERNALRNQLRQLITELPDKEDR